MKPKHLIVGAVMTAFSLLTFAAPEAATPPAGSTAATSAPTAAPKAAKAKSVKKSEQGKTRGLKSKKGKECQSDNGCESGQRS